MKVFSINGRKFANVVFGLFCASILVYMGFAAHDIVVASADDIPPTYAVLIVEQFGTGEHGTREFLYMDLPFVAVMAKDGAYADEDSARLVESGREVVESMDFDDSVVRLTGARDVAKIENSIKSAIRATEDSGYVVFVASIGEDSGRYAAQALNNLKDLFAEKNVQFVSLEELGRHIMP